MILEGIVTTLSEDGTVNIAPMGPLVDRAMRTLVLKPYVTSTTYQNLKRAGQGVFHVTDDVQLLAQAAIGVPDPSPVLQDCLAVDGKIIVTACRWYAFTVLSLDDHNDRTEIVCQVIDHGRLRDFFGFNRGKHAVLEAAILATRIDFLPPGEILAQFQQLRVLVDKTGGPEEQRAFQFLVDFVEPKCAARLA